MSTSTIEPFWVCVDVESTGLSRTKDHVIQFAAYAHTDEGFMSHVHTDRDIPVIVTNMTGVRQEDVAHAPTLREVWSAFGEWLTVQNSHSPAPIILIAHNATFDIDILLHGLARLGMGIRDIAEDLVKGRCVELFVDTLALSRRVFPKATVPNHKLGTLYHHCTGRDLDGAHDALVDVKGLYTVFERMRPSLQRSAYRRIDERWDRWELGSVPSTNLKDCMSTKPTVGHGPVTSPYFDGVSKPPFKRMRIQLAACMGT
jgi:DNA polymerase III alpha subunit (gram-positive type)